MAGKAVVFGGSGFLGSHVADQLTERGFDVTIYDLQLSPYLKENQKMVIGDTLDQEKIFKTIEGASFVYNFSGVADIDECTKDVLAAVKCNILGQTMILEQSKLQKVKRVIYASSVYVYGRHGSFYKITKQTSEHLIEEYKEKFGLDYTILRYGSLYGPRAQAWNGVYRYILQAIREGTIDYPGTGEEKREYINVLDAARLSVGILDPKYKNKCMIITGNYVLTSKELLTMINEILGDKVEIKFTNKTLFHHYNITPYSFTPKLGEKITPNPSLDMGEGILRQIEEIFKVVNNKEKLGDTV
jgi:UDP-glucose 4-epimerase